jgi:hypothetical protein
LKVFAARAIFPRLVSLHVALVARHSILVFVFQSEERSGEESAFGFSVLFKRVQKERKSDASLRSA